MIAQYQRKFGFTAIMVSHEIPDVYFISNRILALYDRSIVFQGSPEELENFDHPFKDEVIRSLEGLQNELTGLYSKRQFKVMHQAQLTQTTRGATYCIAVFSLDDLDIIRTSGGHDAAQVAIRSLGIHIDKHFGAIGGFSTRRRSNEFVTVLPYSDLAEAESMLKDFAEDFQERRIHDVWAEIRGQTKAPEPTRPRLSAQADCIEFGVMAGIAQGQPVADIDSVIDAAKSQQKKIARLRCDGRR